MCGIVGALAFDTFEKKSEERIRTEANIFITTQLLQATVERGKDATGVSLLWSDGNYTGQKMGIASPEFISRFGETEKDFAGLLKLWREYPKLMKIFIGHCRKSSVGNSYDNKNNHPIQVGNMILVHNGTLTNHEKIFDKLNSDRIGDVDSEAIGHLLNHYTDDGNEPFTVDMIKETSRRIHGTYSVLAMSGNNPYQVAQFRDGRPAEMVLVKPLKTVYVASEKKFLENVLFEYNKLSQLFAAGVKFPYLKQADVEFKMLPDDSAALWDLTLPVTDETAIADLYNWEKVPYRVDKIWSGTTTVNKGVNNARTKKPAGTEVSAKNTKSTTDDDDDDNTNSDGLVWSKSLSKYKTQEGFEETKEFGAVTVDVENGAITPIDGKVDDIVKITEVDKNAVENLLSASAVVKEVSLKRIKDAAGSLNDDKKNSSADVNTASVSGKTVEVDMSCDPEAIKKAEEFVNKGLVKYETDDEVANDIEVSDASILRPLSVYALANRIKKFIFKRGFITGYVARKSEEQADAPDVTQEGKNTKAEKKIRLLKTVVKIMAACLEMRCRGNTPLAVKKMIELAIETVRNTPKGIEANISLAFSVGDIKNIPLLGEIKEQVEE